jgi:hypothetical protein
MPLNETGSPVRKGVGSSHTLLHEIAHIQLGHTKEETNESRAEREVHAEAVAYLCMAALNQPGLEYSRGYIQNWLGQGSEIGAKAAIKIFSAADKILNAGRPVAEGGCPQG